MKQGL